MPSLHRNGTGGDRERWGFRGGESFLCQIPKCRSEPLVQLDCSPARRDRDPPPRKLPSVCAGTSATLWGRGARSPAEDSAIGTRGAEAWHSQMCSAVLLLDLQPPGPPRAAPVPPSPLCLCTFSAGPTQTVPRFPRVSLCPPRGISPQSAWQRLWLPSGGLRGRWHSRSCRCQFDWH